MCPNGFPPPNLFFPPMQAIVFIFSGIIIHVYKRTSHRLEIGKIPPTPSVGDVTEVRIPLPLSLDPGVEGMPLCYLVEIKDEGG